MNAVKVHRRRDPLAAKKNEVRGMGERRENDFYIAQGKLEAIGRIPRGMERSLVNIFPSRVSLNFKIVWWSGKHRFFLLLIVCIFFKFRSRNVYSFNINTYIFPYIFPYFYFTLCSRCFSVSPPLFRAANPWIWTADTVTYIVLYGYVYVQSWVPLYKDVCWLRIAIALFNRNPHMYNTRLINDIAIRIANRDPSLDFNFEQLTNYFIS